MNLHNNYSLKQHNTFGIDVRAKHFANFSTIDELRELLNYRVQSKIPLIILGGGSNILFLKDIDGLVIKNQLKGIELIKEDAHHYYVKAAAGENWHAFVMHCIKHNYGGLENLSLIPGYVGASPMQNIGAYGVEIKTVFESLEALNIEDGTIHTFSTNYCRFGYRESIFKREYKDRFIILNVTFRLDKQPAFNTSYGAIEQELAKMGVTELAIQAISQAVINIRRSKLPDPDEIGNAGSFFKNPTIPLKQFRSLYTKYERMPHYVANDDRVKIPAAWLIEQCGWKGYRKGDAGVHIHQPLVLVNYAYAKGNDIYALSEEILHSVKNKFGIELEREVNIIPLH